MKPAFSTARQNMIESQIKPFNVVDAKVLNAFGKIPREVFVPIDRQGMAYFDEDLPMGHGRFLSEPSAYAKLIQEVGINDTHTVLDVGCLSGYSSLILAHLAKAVIAVDESEWVTKAKKLCVQYGKDNLIFASGELTEGNSQHAPYDVIAINGAVQTIPQALVNQLKDGGRIATFYRGARGEGHAVIYHKHKGDLRKEILFDAFVPLLEGFQKAEGFNF